ncbi:hypothetical protein HY408_00240 [Candidatus Gottesmanbacteria bacterium]|nr:hypothetical protein [Candidatus Gottesmanbacteria bacterium]
MDISTEVIAFKETLEPARTVVIVMPEVASRDAIAAGLALYLSLKQLQKTVTVVCGKPATVGLSHLVGINKLTTKTGNKNFVISLDYQEGAIEKVSYNIEGNKFNLVIEPRTGAPLLDEKNVSYSYSGMGADLIITIEAPTKESLGKLYFENKSLFDEKPLVVIDNKTANAQYGKINLVRPSASVSELVAHLLRVGELPVDMDIASNLYDGITFTTHNFTSAQVNAVTFESAAWLMHQGARKVGVLRQEELPRREFSRREDEELPETPPDWLKPKIYKGSTLL